MLIVDLKTSGKRSSSVLTSLKPSLHCQDFGHNWQQFKKLWLTQDLLTAQSPVLTYVTINAEHIKYGSIALTLDKAWEIGSTKTILSLFITILDSLFFFFFQTRGQSHSYHNATMNFFKSWPYHGQNHGQTCGTQARPKISFQKTVLAGHGLRCLSIK